MTHERLAWTPVAGAQSYQVQIVPLGLAGQQGEEVSVNEPGSAVLRVPATYRVRALRQTGDPLTASEWSAPVTMAPVAASPAAFAAPSARSFAPVIIGAALVALLVGAALGIGGLRVYQSANATRTPTPVPADVVAATQQVATQAAERGTQVAALEMAMQRTLDAEMTRTHQPSPTPSPTLTPSATPNATATRDAIVAAFAADLTRTAAAFTATPTPTTTSTPSRTATSVPTPDVSGTAVALAAEMLSRATCALVNRAGLILPVFSGPYAGDRQLLSQAPLLAEVIESRTIVGESGVEQRWLRIAFAGDGGQVEGWLRVPPEADLMH
ncbi:MAG: hypothetical protein KatS3mg051_0658 [Anaerolineae bacterium]|nr:MAG: hypothetical protein KatS3mg051_0658 [Anaerolineae bacterium]